jgi:hypothetical protein
VLTIISIHHCQATFPLVDYYQANGVLQSFQGTKSDLIYPEVKRWLDGFFQCELVS